jgi:hypothetical protein
MGEALETEPRDAMLRHQRGDLDYAEGASLTAIPKTRIWLVTFILLLDESDAAFNGEKEYAEALRGILNTGYRRSGAAAACDP